MANAIQLEQESAPITVALAISHTPWVPERVASLERLLGQLDASAYDVDRTRLRFTETQMMTERAANDVWSEHMWQQAADSEATHCLFLQDDVEVCPSFWEALRAIIEVRSRDVIGLEVAHPIAKDLAREDVRLFTTSDMLIGPGYVVPRETLVAFLEWRKTRLKELWRSSGPDGKAAITEDTMLGVFCLSTGRKIVHPVPTIIDHDTSIASTYGNDEHTNRRPHVTWKDAAEYGGAWDETDLTGPGFWMGRFKRMRRLAPDGTDMGWARAHTLDPKILTGAAPVPHAGRFYEATPKIARRWVEGFGEREYRRALADNGGVERRRFFHAAMARASTKPRKKLLVCTPVRSADGVDPRYAARLLGVSQMYDADIQHGFELLDSWLWDQDVVRVRSRFVRAFLETDADLLHFRDSDVVVSERCLRGMMLADRDFVLAPYPRRDGIDWAQVKLGMSLAPETPLEAFAYKYAVEVLEQGLEWIDAKACTRIAAGPLGCAIIKRELLEAMVDFYRDLDEQRVDIIPVLDKLQLGRLGRAKLESFLLAMAVELQRWRDGHMGLKFTDLHQGEMSETVALYQLLIRRGVLCSEDTSFCHRVRDMGRDVWMYLGPGSPCDHIGKHVYAGKSEAWNIVHNLPDQRRAVVAPKSTDFALDPPEDPARDPEEPAVP